MPNNLKCYSRYPNELNGLSTLSKYFRILIRDAQLISKIYPGYPTKLKGPRPVI